MIYACVLNRRAKGVRARSTGSGHATRDHVRKGYKTVPKLGRDANGLEVIGSPQHVAAVLYG